MLKKAIAFFVSFALVFTFSPHSVYAIDSSNSSQSVENEIYLQIENLEIRNTSDNEIELSFALVQTYSDNSTEYSANQTINIGSATITCQLLPGNGVGYFNWSVSLTNDDLIKKVDMTLVLEKVSLLSPNIAKEKVAYNAGVGTLYNRASGSSSFYLDEDNTPKDMKVRFKCSGFKITGVKDIYLIPDSSVVGLVSDGILEVGV